MDHRSLEVTKTSRGVAESGARTAAEFKDSTSSREADRTASPPPAGGALVEVRLRVTTESGEIIPDARIAIPSNDAVRIEREGSVAVLHGTLPMIIQIGSEETAGLRTVRIESPPKDIVNITLRRKVNIQLAVKFPPGAEMGSGGVFVCIAGESVDLLYLTAPDANISTAEGNCKAGWANEQFDTGLVEVKIQDGSRVELAAAARATGVVEVRSKESPILQFTVDPSRGKSGAEALQRLGVREPRREGELWLFDRVPQGDAWVVVTDEAKNEFREARVTVEAGKVVKISI
ncbi:MAG: hypothetical protein HY286_19965 [Planctomycetes bacterium]|nr:hypothetical protein [Planctomycetota bacterium]